MQSITPNKRILRGMVCGQRICFVPTVAYGEAPNNSKWAIDTGKSQLPGYEMYAGRCATIPLEVHCTRGSFIHTIDVVLQPGSDFRNIAYQSPMEYTPSFEQPLGVTDIPKGCCMYADSTACNVPKEGLGMISQWRLVFRRV